VPIHYLVAPAQHAVNQLARLWTQANSADRAAISAASNRIDAELAWDADQKGKSMASISRTLRSLDDAPLRVYFHAIESACIARIIEYELIP
jgi:hypothetical protein